MTHQLGLLDVDIQNQSARYAIGEAYTFFNVFFWANQSVSIEPKVIVADMIRRLDIRIDGELMRLIENIMHNLELYCRMQPMGDRKDFLLHLRDELVLEQAKRVQRIKENGSFDRQSN